MWMHRLALAAAVAAGLTAGCQRSPFASPRGVPVTKPTHATTLPVAQPTEIAATEPAPTAPVPRVEPTPPPATQPSELSTTLPAGPSIAAPGSRPKPAPPTSAKPLAPGEVVAVSALQVNDKFVSVGEILRLAHRELDQVPKNITESTFRLRAAEIIQEVIRGRITQLLVLREATKRVTEEMTKQIDKELADLKKEWVVEIGKGSVQKLEAVLREDGTSLKELLEDERNRLISQAYLREKFIASIYVNHRMLMDYFRKHQAEFSSDKQVQMQLIAEPEAAFLNREATGQPTAAERTRARDQARAVIEQCAAELKNGADFGELAKKRSKGLKAEQGGLWPMLSAGSFKETRVEEAAFAMTKGQVSDIIETPSGFFIVKVADVKPGKVADFEQVQEQIESALRQQQYRRMTDTYLQDMLRHATIVHSEEFTRLAIDRAVNKYWQKTTGSGQ